jgi:hypothetical protein
MKTKNNDGEDMNQEQIRQNRTQINIHEEKAYSLRQIKEFVYEL